MGVAGMFLAAFGHPVTITDYDEDCLDLLRLNTAHNGLTNTDVRKLDWNKGDLAATFDLICGAELIYREEVIPPLIALLRRHLSPGGEVFLAHDRQRRSVEKFISRLPADAEVESIGKTFRGKDTAHRILIHHLRFAT
jgi:methylase of polypeptide subunit release factors